MFNKVLYFMIFAGILLALTVYIIDNKVVGNIPESEEFAPENFDWQHNGKGGEYIVKLIQGEIEGKTKGEVLTDENCERDEEGLSRCNQKVLLENGDEIEFIMPHNMMKHRCLSPGETIEIVPYTDDGYVKTII
ncbi:MAG TPA: hypothetical protein VK105_18275 [Virgibacillus sp.]|nr:hypothetical protein [Virgibacillus sp.]HLR69033.1 hypothetical protein [Virgibacillus sp.]